MSKLTHAFSCALGACLWVIGCGPANAVGLHAPADSARAPSGASFGNAMPVTASPGNSAASNGNAGTNADHSGSAGTNAAAFAGLGGADAKPTGAMRTMLADAAVPTAGSQAAVAGADGNTTTAIAGSPAAGAESDASVPDAGNALPSPGMCENLFCFDIFDCVIFHLEESTVCNFSDCVDFVCK